MIILFRYFSTDENAEHDTQPSTSTELDSAELAESKMRDKISAYHFDQQEKAEIHEKKIEVTRKRDREKLRNQIRKKHKNIVRSDVNKRKEENVRDRKRKHERTHDAKETAKINLCTKKCMKKVRSNELLKSKETEKNRERRKQLKKKNAAEKELETKRKKEQDEEKRREKKYGKTLEECIQMWEEDIKYGPSYICTCCHRTWFKRSVVLVSKLQSIPEEMRTAAFTGKLSFDEKEWLCLSCKSSLSLKKFPKLCVKVNKLYFPKRSENLKKLFPLEERLISIRIPFMTVYKKGVNGQLEMKGSVVNVPVDILPMLLKLPRLPSDAHTIMLLFKRKMEYKKNEWVQNIRPNVVLKAFDDLKDSSLYLSHNIEYDSENWERIINEIRNAIEKDVASDNDGEEVSALNNEKEVADIVNNVTCEDADVSFNTTNVSCENVEKELHSHGEDKVNEAVIEDVDEDVEFLITTEETVKRFFKNSQSKENSSFMVDLGEIEQNCSTGSSEQPQDEENELPMPVLEKEGEFCHGESDDMSSTSSGWQVASAGDSLLRYDYEKIEKKLQRHTEEYIKEGKDRDLPMPVLEKEDLDEFIEHDPKENQGGNFDTMFDPGTDEDYRTMTFAPGEGQHPLSLFQDEDCEYLSFPSIYCGEKMQRKTAKGDPIHYSDQVKWELTHHDRRAANSVPNIFFKAKKLQIQQVVSKGTFAMKRTQDENQFTAGDLLQPENILKLQRFDEGHYVFKQIRNSPPYLMLCRKQLHAMIRQIGSPTWFMSLSAADTKWIDLLNILRQDEEDVKYKNVPTHELPWQYTSELVSKNPVICARFFNNRCDTFIQNVLMSPHNPIGKVVDYAYRIEFQYRGSPHIHLIVWCEDAPSADMSEEEIAEYIDKYVSCSVDVPDDCVPFLEMQRHLHTKTCAKGSKKPKPSVLTRCRFGFDIPPMRKTRVLHPLPLTSKKEEKERKSLYCLYIKIKEHLRDLQGGKDISLDNFFNELGCTEEQYINAVRSSLNKPKIFYKRSCNEIRINPYMKNCLGAWKANHDIQFVLDAYACAHYISEYITKCTKGMSELMENALKEAREGHKDLKQQVRSMGNVFLNATEISAQEAVYLALQMPLFKKSREVIFVNTSEPSKRVKLVKPDKMLRQLDAESTEIYFATQIEKYASRPDKLKGLCMADFYATVNVQHVKKQSHKDPFEDNDDDNLIVEDETVNSNNVENVDNESVKENTTYDFTVDGIRYTSRRRPRILRYVKYNKKIDPDNYYREQILLFYPWTGDENDIKGDCESYNQRYSELKKSITENCAKYEKVDIREVTEIDHDSINSMMDELAASLCQQNGDQEDGGLFQSKDHAFYDPPRPDFQSKVCIGQDLGIASSKTDHLVSDYMSTDEYLKLTRSLNNEQREFILDIVKYVKDWEPGDKAYLAFLTGGAGT